MLEQLLDRLVLNGIGDERSIIQAATLIIRLRNPGHTGHFRALMNYRSTVMVMQAFEMLEALVHWTALREDDRKEWARLITGLFDTLASGTIPPPNHLLSAACLEECIPIIEKIFDQAKANPAFQEQLMQPEPTSGLGPLGEVAERGDVATLRYLCQQDGIEAHAFSRSPFGDNILGLCTQNLTVEIVELLPDNFPGLVSERRSQSVAWDHQACQAKVGQREGRQAHSAARAGETRVRRR